MRYSLVFMTNSTRGQPAVEPWTSPPGAIGNAVAHALGIRIRDMPLTRVDAICRALKIDFSELALRVEDLGVRPRA